MIGKTIRNGMRLYVCEDCGDVGQFNNYDRARAAGWAISYDRKNCYCPICAPFRRNVGKTGARRRTVQTKIEG